jgi:hypothetical protein
MRKVLLDEGVPHGVRGWLTDHEVVTVQWLGWDGIKNGQLLTSAKNQGFEVIITADQQWPYQQNLPEHHVGIIVITNSNWLLLRSNTVVREALLVAVEVVQPGEISVVEVV